MKNHIDYISKGTASLAVLALLLVLAAVGDWSGVVALFVGIALGVANSKEIREFFSG
jgi:hypothetical protein